VIAYQACNLIDARFNTAQRFRGGRLCEEEGGGIEDKIMFALSMAPTVLQQGNRF
jgi:hypothetical protein